MYRMLENTCDKNNSYKDNRDDLGPDIGPTFRKIMQHPVNKTEHLLEILKQYTTLEDQRRQLVESLRDFMADEPTELDSVKHLLNGPNVYYPSGMQSTLHNTDTMKYIKKPNYIIDCSNIHEVRLQSKIGHGVSKQTFKSDFRGRSVAVKMVTRHQSEVKTCLEKVNDDHPKKNELRSRCYVFPTMKLMKEILMLDQLSHPGFVQLLGYCVRNEESETTDLNERGIASVFELGERVMFYNLQTLTWQERLRHATELADFLNYLQHSPLGSLRIRDFKEDHFLLVNNSIKMIDLDDVDNLEPSCNVYVSAETQDDLARSGKHNGCEFDLTCQRGMCIGFNAKQNMRFMNVIFFKRLLFPTIFPRQISSDIGYLLADIDSNLLTAASLTHRLVQIQNTMLTK